MRANSRNVSWLDVTVNCKVWGGMMVANLSRRGIVFINNPLICESGTFGGQRLTEYRVNGTDVGCNVQW